jgi:ABC-type Zn uptake system ZnuABC Zn-binding protein ZnuA
MSWRSNVALALALVLLSACSVSQAPTPNPGAIDVVTTTTVFADLVANVGGSHVNVHSIVPKGGDVHTFDPSPSDAAAVSGAKLVIMNGLGLDDWLLPFMQDTGNANVPILKLGEGLTDATYISADDGTVNPHLWMDVGNAREYVDRIRLKLDEVDPSNQGDYDANAAAYDAQLASLDAEVRSQLASIPQEQRKLVAFHDAFPYYARAYGIEIVGVVTPVPGQDPSAGEIADLITAIKGSGVKLILSEVQFPDQLVREIASDTGTTVESDLYDDALTDTVPTYVQMIRWDTDKIVAGLQ